MRLLSCLLLLLGAVGLPAQAPQRIPVLFDTDIGTDIDDPFALALLLASPEVELRGVTTVGDSTQTRAMFLCRFLTMTGRRHTNVAAGDGTQPARPITKQYQYYYHPDVLFNRTIKPVKETAVEFLHARLKAQPGKVSIIAAGPLTNIARLVTDKPESRPWIRQVIVNGQGIALDVKAAQAVLASGVPLLIVPAKHNADLKLPLHLRQRVFSPGSSLTRQVEAIYQLWDTSGPVPMADALSAALAFEGRFVDADAHEVEIDDRGELRLGKGKPNAKVVGAVRGQEFVRWYADRIASCRPPHRVPAKLIEAGNMPHRVHVAEDFETDIERRWWMSGKAEHINLPPGSTRACRGVLTHDFDDLLGNPKEMHTAVIFNPVPGPPMGKNTRLSFRYWLSGTDRLRVQIYSLTNGYHRHLMLTNLPQGKWQSATVDMTVARRPDGTGGPLAEGERIDDIQFYTDASAELIIDDIVLYEAAGAEEKRPFPKRIHFTGWFDSGAQGKEWPGTYKIIPEKGYFWKAAGSVPNDEGNHWIRLHLRGERPVGETTHLSFRHLITGSDSLKIVLVNSKTKASYPAELKGLRKDHWTSMWLQFPTEAKQGKAERIDEIHFLLPKGAELLLDDVLLYEPGQ